MGERLILPEKILNNVIEEQISQNLTKNDVMREINGEFVRKKLRLKKLTTVLSGALDVSNLTAYEKIAILKGLENKFPHNDDVRCVNYFTDMELADYETYIQVEEDVNTIELKNFTRLDRYHYYGLMSFKQVYLYMTYMLLYYNQQTQRDSKIDYTKSFEPIRRINLNKKSVSEIATAVLNNSFYESQIILNCRVISGKSQKFRFNEIQGNNGDIEIEIDYNIESDSTTYVDILDGYHRLNGIKQAVEKHYEKTGEWLEGYISVKLVRYDVKNAQALVGQIFKRTDTNKDWLRVLGKDDYKDFVDKLIQNSKQLKYKVGNYYEEYSAFKMFTHKLLLIDTVKALGIPVNDDIAIMEISEGMAKSIDILISLLIKECDIERYRYLYSANIFALYLKFAYECTKNEDVKIDDYKEFVKMLRKIKEDDIKTLQLTYKNYNLDKIFNFYNEKTRGV